MRGFIRLIVAGLIGIGLGILFLYMALMNDSTLGTPWHGYWKAPLAFAAGGAALYVGLKNMRQQS